MSSSRFTVEAKHADFSDFSVVLLHAADKNALSVYAGKYLLTYQLDALRAKFGSSVDVVIVLGFAADEIIQKTGLCRKERFILNLGYAGSSSATSAFLGVHATVKHNVYLVYGDTPFGVDTFTDLRKTHLLVSKDVDGVGVVSQDGIITHLSYGLEDKWSGILLLAGTDVDVFLREYADSLLMYEILNKVIDSGVKILHG